MAKADITQYQSLYEKLQVEKDNLGWREKDFNMKNNIGDVLRQSSGVSDSRIRDLQMEIEKQIDSRKLIESIWKKYQENLVRKRPPNKKELARKEEDVVRVCANGQTVHEFKLEK
ncbi:hypothetical protein L1987_60132 [Smallanthus sonchifolius]|uniref:Uncharacterized protein n=1 Tax=Smallanthus sonchifolius TaxID=185202 RepID=A0ACB9D7F7_9ASTR|nr:hypothetical protein L1987_60132 [Smallanthus sonchifolius]